MQIGMEPLVIDWAKEEPKMGRSINLNFLKILQNCKDGGPIKMVDKLSSFSCSSRF